MKVFAISDLHLSFSTPSKSMEVFSDTWIDYQEKIKSNWQKVISKDDLVLISGDISWALKIKDALIDLEFIASLPGKKVIIKGNHDYWWTSPTKLKEELPSSIFFIQNNSLLFEDIAISGARLWDTAEYHFDEYIDFVFNPNSHKNKNIENAKDSDINKKLEIENQKELSEKQFEKELIRLKISLDQMDKNAKTKIVMTHYPPISADLKPSKVSQMLEDYKINISVFGHLHSVKKSKKMFGEKNTIKYVLTSADYLDFKPIQIV